MCKVVSRDGTTVAYQKAGDGPPIVLLDGSLRDHAVLEALVPEPAPHRATCVHGRPGRGQGAGSPRYALIRETQDLEAVIEEADGSALAVIEEAGGSALAVIAVPAGAASAGAAGGRGRL
jgi:hypothetical protein